MKKTIKIKKNYEFKKVFKKGNYFSGKVIECFYLKNKTDSNYFGVAISTKICKAVKRNRIKRIIREAYNSLENNINTGNTFIFLWKKRVNILECNYNIVKEDMINIFSKVGIYKNEKNCN